MNATPVVLMGCMPSSYIAAACLTVFLWYCAWWMYVYLASMVQFLSAFISKCIFYAGNLSDLPNQWWCLNVHVCRRSHLFSRFHRLTTAFTAVPCATSVILVLCTRATTAPTLTKQIRELLTISIEAVGTLDILQHILYGLHIKKGQVTHSLPTLRSDVP